jgi:hypothetical protein
MNDLPEESAEALVNLIRQRIESRYRRILFVHTELAKIDTAAQQSLDVSNSGTALTGGSFEDFVFSRIDFSIYKKIDAEEFNLLFDEGLADYEESFYQKSFAMGREEIHRTINGAYIKAGPFYVCKKGSRLLLSIMRTIHTSLEFAPLLRDDDLSGIDKLRALAEVLDALVIRHNDGMETKLFVPKEPVNAAGTKDDPLPLLCGTFYPLGKACTVTLIHNAANT